MGNNLIEVFSGSDIDANYISSILTENNIDHILDNRLNQSISAGWVSGSFDNSSLIRTNAKDAEKARMLINEYLKNSKE